MKTRSLLIVLTALTFRMNAAAADAVIEEGSLAGAPFRIDIPQNWNGSLVMYAHGYNVAGYNPPFQVDFAQTAGALGFAVAQSRYSRQGWAAREGILETEALRKYFAEKYGTTSPTIIAGHSQGGAITYGTIERYPEVYDGALPFCAVGPSALEFFKERVFDMRVLFDHYFPGLPGSAVVFPEGTETISRYKPIIADMIAKDPEKAAAFARLTSLSSTDSIPEVIALWSEMLREFGERTGGNPFDNTDTLYAGSADDAALNRQIGRFAADEKAEAYLREWVTLNGDISDPVLAVHTLVDDLIPPAFANQYAALTARKGTSQRYVQRWVDRNGHCAFNPGETKEALRLLAEWIKSGKAPAAGELRVN